MNLKILEKIARNANRMDAIEKFNDGFGFTTVYGIETESLILKVWNSSNNSYFNHRDALKEIADYIEDGETSGEFSNGGFINIMWEVIEK